MAVNYHSENLCSISHGSKLKYCSNLQQIVIIENADSVVNYRSIFITLAPQYYKNCLNSCLSLSLSLSFSLSLSLSLCKLEHFITIRKFNSLLRNIKLTI